MDTIGDPNSADEGRYRTSFTHTYFIRADDKEHQLNCKLQKVLEIELLSHSLETLNEKFAPEKLKLSIKF